MMTLRGRGQSFRALEVSADAGGSHGASEHVSSARDILRWGAGRRAAPRCRDARCPS